MALLPVQEVQDNYNSSFQQVQRMVRLVIRKLARNLIADKIQANKDHERVDAFFGSW